MNTKERNLKKCSFPVYKMYRLKPPILSKGYMRSIPTDHLSCVQEMREQGEPDEARKNKSRRTEF